MVLIFFFQAEDGIRDYKVTGVQTCALPILTTQMIEALVKGIKAANRKRQEANAKEEVREALDQLLACRRSEERRVGKEVEIAAGDASLEGSEKDKTRRGHKHTPKGDVAPAQ